MKPIYYILLGAIFFILTWLFTGISSDDEFHELSIFGKYPLTSKVYFYSPLGQSDSNLLDLSPEEQIEERAFREFVIDQDQQNNSSPPRGYLPILLIQLTLTFLTIGFYQIKSHLNLQRWQLATHFLVTMPFTMLGIGFALVLHNTVWSSIFIFLCNYLTICLLTKKQISQNLVLLN